MKSLMLIGGITGFAGGFAFCNAHHMTWSASVGRGSLSAALAGLVLTWWGLTWNDSTKIADTRHQANGSILTTSTQSNTL